jgi:hypothetical protein
MALNTPGLKSDIKNLLQAMTSQTDSAAGFNKFADELGDAIEKYVKSGIVTVASGIPVSTAGSAAAQTGATTSTGTGTIS